MNTNLRRRTLLAAIGGISALPMLPARAQKAYGPGVSDTEIRIGQTMPYSGPVALNSVQGRVQAAYFQRLNEQGGINGRKITLLSVDDGYNPPKTVEQVRKLVETDEVAFLFATLGTPTSMAVRKYLNDRKIPQLFVGSGAEQLNDPKNFPWTLPFPPSFYDEGRIHGRNVLKSHPNEKIAVLYQNDDYGKNVLRGFREGLGAEGAKRIVAEASYQVTDPSVDSQIISLMGSGATVFMNASTSKVAGQAARKIYELKKKITHLVAYGAASGAIGQKPPAGAEGTQEFVMGSFLKDPANPQLASDPAVLTYLETLKKYYPEGNPNEFLVTFGYACAQLLETVLRKCGDNLTRENILKQATTVDAQIPMMLAGVRARTTPANYFPIRQMRLQKYDGARWVAFGDVISAE